MGLRIQSSVDLTKMDVQKSNWSGTSVTSTAVGGKQEIEQPIRESIKEAIKDPARENGIATKSQAKVEELDKETVEQAVESINGAIEYINRGLRFSVHEDTQRIVVKVVDVLTDEVIKELPPEDVLDTAARIREAIGLLIDERA